MKKTIKIIFLLLVGFIIFSYVGIIFLFATLDWYRSNYSRWETVAYGESMYPTIKNEQPFQLDTFINPEIGDIISFSCFNKCIEGETASNGEKILTKRVLDRDENCFWVEGDNKDNSYDSREFGWICKNEDIRINGTVTAIGDTILKPTSTFSDCLMDVIKHAF